MSKTKQFQVTANSSDAVTYALVKGIPFFVLVIAAAPIYLSVVVHLLNPNNAENVKHREFNELVRRCTELQYQHHGKPLTQECKVWANTKVRVYGNL